MWAAALGAVAVSVAFAVGYALGSRITTGEQQAARLAEIEARDTSNATIIEAYRTELDRTRNRPARRVFLCPDVPGAAGPAPDPTAPGIPAGSGSTARDIGPILAECRDTAIQLGALIDAVSVRPAK